MSPFGNVVCMLATKKWIRLSNAYTMNSLLCMNIRSLTQINEVSEYN